MYNNHGYHSEPKEQYALSISCTALAQTDLLSPPDTYVLVYLKNSKKEPSQLIGQTEKINNSYKPKFKTKINLPFFFEKQQTLSFVVKDSDTNADDLVGEYACTVSKICSDPKNSHTGVLALKSSNNRGKIHLHVEPVVGSGDEFLNLKLRGRNLPKMDFLGKSDPYFKIQAYSKSAGKLQTLIKSNIRKKTLNPEWNMIELSLLTLCNGDKSKKFIIRVYDKDLLKSEEIGSVETSIQDLLSRKPLTLTYGRKSRGTIEVAQIMVEDRRKYSFTEYLQGGLEISVAASIDFTMSNGKPHKPNSLHFVNPNPHYLNPYQSAISAIGSILAPYDHDGMINAYGFGAKLPPHQSLSHCFDLNGQNSLCQGVQGVLNAYYQAINTVSLWGPTNFAPTIRQAIKLANGIMCQDVQQYTILIIITDGAISDMDDTMDAIVEASFYPLSIVIVGVGNADFSSMNILDGDGKRLQSPKNRKYAARDIVQFVQYSQNLSMEQLAAETLHEIPGQVTEFLHAQKIKPNIRN